ncbi:ABC-type Fe3+-siderophore transport system, permease 2 component [Lachnospiraceae bacterium KM106-2]|nr:ABC-type Fe3+-siderophore transport system, permease 2 component [Lachnospiraceae bacterium KM106-2]
MSVTIILLLVVIALILITLCYGNTSYSLDVVVRVLRGEQIKGATYTISKLRLPRMLAAVLTGLAFGMAGNTFQTMLRNPLASPDVIGISSGSSVAAVFCILVLNMSGNGVSFAAVISGLLVAGAIYLLAQGNGFSGGRLILIGIGIQAMVSALISFLLSRAAQNDVSSAMRWISGSLNGVRIENIPRLFFVVIICGTIIVLMTKYLQILELGEEFAITLGVRTNLVRVLLMISAVCLIAFATALTGPIASVAFIAGPIAVRMTGIGFSNVIPSGLVGAALVLAADLIGQFAFPSRYPVGIITGILGAPYMLILLVRMNRKGGTT